MNRWAWVGIIVVALLGVMTWAIVERQRLLDAMPPEVRDAIQGAWRGFRIERDQQVAMPDGTLLAADVFRPRRGSSSRLPTVLVRLPYDKRDYGEAIGIAMFFAARDFVVVLQDMRGRFRSKGEFVPSKDDAADGDATLDWIVRQPWSNGRVGTIGCSSLGESQVMMATRRNPAHAAMIAQGAAGAVGTAGGRYTFFGLYEGGVLNLATAFGWFLEHGSKTPGQPARPPLVFSDALEELPVLGMVGRHRRDPTDFDDFVSKPLDDPYWPSLGYISDTHRFNTPALLINTWHDQTVADTFVLSEVMKRNADSERAAQAHHVIIAPGNHCDYQYVADRGRVGEQPVGEAARQPYWDWYLGWFNHWLRDESAPLPELPAYLLYVMGEDVWLKSPTWPPPGVVERRWYLDDRSLLEVPPRDRAADSFTYDPMNPTPTRGGPVCCTDDRIPPGPADQREVERRADVLVYSSAALPDGLRIAGPLAADLYVSSDALDTDFVAKLVDVWPDGTALNVQEGALRMRYRDGYRDPQALDPGNVYRISLDMRAIAHFFKPGHRIRLQISSSNFPRLERNLNTGGRNVGESTAVKAVNQVLRGGDTPSSIVLPVLSSLEGLD